MTEIEKRLKVLMDGEYPEPRCTGARGNFKAKVLAIAPPMLESEYEHGLPLTGVGGTQFHQLLLECAGVDSEEDWLILPCSMFHEAKKKSAKPSKVATKPIIDFLEEATTKKWFDRYVCVGAVAFSEVFNIGRVAKIRPYLGNIVKMPSFNYCEVVALPDIDFLHVPYRDRQNYSRRDESVANLKTVELRNLLTKMRAKLK